MSLLGSVQLDTSVCTMFAKRLAVPRPELSPTRLMKGPQVASRWISRPEGGSSAPASPLCSAP